MTSVWVDMAALAIVARPRFVVAGALLVASLAGSREPERAPVAARAPLPVVIQLQPHSDIARIEADTNDSMNIGVGPLASWISHLLQKLTSDAV